MATIILHAGMPKTGSTSIQRWIIHNADRIRRQNGVQVLVATSGTRRNPSDEVRLEPYESGDVNSGRLVKTWMAAGQAPEVVRGLLVDRARHRRSALAALLAGRRAVPPRLREARTRPRGTSRVLRATPAH